MKFPVNKVVIFYITLPEEIQKQGSCSKTIPRKNDLTKGLKLTVFSVDTERSYLLSQPAQLACVVFIKHSD